MCYNFCKIGDCMNFKIYEDNKEIVCNIIKIFKDDSNDINYIIYTDGTKNDNGDLEIYASRYVLENNNYILADIENDYEWNLIDNMLESMNKGN